MPSDNSRVRILHLAHDGLERRVGSGHCDMRPQLDPGHVGGGGTVGNSPHETSRHVNIGDAGDVIECKAAWQASDDSERGGINLKRSPDDVWIAAEVTLPKAVVENCNRMAAVLCIGWVDVAPEKRAYHKETLGI